MKSEIGFRPFKSRFEELLVSAGYVLIQDSEGNGVGKKEECVYVCAFTFVRVMLYVQFFL